MEKEDPLEEAKRIIRENIKPVGTRIVLISDNLPAYEVLIRAVLDEVVVVPVQYGCWDLQRLKMEIISRAGLPEKQFETVGFLDHGLPGEFCLLKSVAGGTIDLGDFKNASDSPLLTDFFKFIASYVKKAKDPQNWRKDLDSRIDLMACDVAKDAAGMELITHLENITGVNWAASTNKTGAGAGVENGYDWVLETEEKLGSVAGTYFEEEKLVKWKHHASGVGALWTVGEFIANKTPCGVAITSVANAGCECYNAETWGEVGASVAWAGTNIASAGSLNMAKGAVDTAVGTYNDIADGNVENIGYAVGNQLFAKYGGENLNAAKSAYDAANTAYNQYNEQDDDEQDDDSEYSDDS